MTQQKDTAFESADSLVDILQITASSSPNAIAFSQGSASMSFQELDEHSDKLAGYLAGLNGIQKGDRVLVQLPNCLAFPVSVFAALKAELIVVPCNPLYTQYELDKVLNDAKPSIVICLTGRYSKSKYPGIRHTITSDLFDFASITTRLKYACFSALAQMKTFGKYTYRKRIRRCIRFDKPLPKSIPTAEDIALLQYTGGSNGIVKGAILRHKNLVTNVKQIHSFLGGNIKEAQECSLTVLPLFHIFSFTLHCALSIRTSNHAALVANPTDLDEIFSVWQQRPVTILCGVNPLFSRILKSPKRALIDWKSLKMCIAGGMKLDVELAKKWQSEVKIPILEGYGMSETSPVISMNHPDSYRLGTVGSPLPQTEIKILPRDEDSDKGLREGEICIKGPQVCTGYWNQEAKESEQYFVDGFFRSGDLGYFDESSRLVISGRSKPMFIVSGFNVYQRELEAAFRQIKEIKTFHISATNQSILGDLISVKVRLKKGENISVAEIKKHCRNLLIGYKIPRKILIQREPQV